MRFLNRDWANGAYDDFTLALYHSVYLRHLLEIASELPAGARVFSLMSRGMLLSGGALIGSTRSGDRLNLVVKLTGDEAQAFLDLEYLGVNWDASELDALQSAQQCQTEEFDVTPAKLIEHRILLRPEGEAVIRFKDLKFHAKAAEEE